MIPYGRQDINQNDIDAVLEVLQSDFITQGPVVPRFEQEMANRCKATHAVALRDQVIASGQYQIHLLLQRIAVAIVVPKSIL